MTDPVTAGPIAQAFGAHGKRAALMPYLMGGYPSVDESLAAGLAAVDAGADLIELGIPFSDPLADGPVIHAAGTAALEAGVTPSDFWTKAMAVWRLTTIVDAFWPSVTSTSKTGGRSPAVKPACCSEVTRVFA